MSYTYEDFVMESAMVETTNETSVDDITMEQFVAEYNVAMAAFNAYNKYSLISEYATCDVEEYIQESLDEKIDKVDNWKNSGGKAKKALGTAASAVLKMIRAVANFFKRLFGKETNPFAKLAKTIRNRKGMSKKALQAKLSDTEGRLSATENKLGEARRNLAASEKELASTKGELAAAKSNLADWQAHSAKNKAELNESKEAVKQLGLQVANWRNQYEALEKSLDETIAALESTKKAKSESDAALKKAQDQLSRANAILAKAAGAHNRYQAKKINAAAYIHLNSEDVDYYGNHAAARKKAAESMDDIAVDLDELAKASQNCAEKLEKVSVTMSDVKDSEFLPPAIVSAVEKITENANEIGRKSVMSVAEFQKDPVIAAFNIAK